MTEPTIISREAIAAQADAAARIWVADPSQPKPTNPYSLGTDAAKHWKASFERALVLHSAPDAEASA